MLGVNSSTSRWVDVLELAQARDVEVTNDKGKVVTEEFIAAMESYKKRPGKEGAGIVWRWLVGCDSGDNRVHLMVQALPCNLDKVKTTPTLRQDSTRGIVVAKFPTGYSSFTNIPGPKPMFFSENPQATASELKSSPQLAFDYMQMLLARLLETEQITKEEAEAFLEDPVLGKTKTPLVRTWESVAKKSASSPKPSASSKGKFETKK